MALKDIFTMIKADRYTADGKDELNKALEADVKDRTYQVGEISQKTGLQKQGDGSWAPPKNAKANVGSKESGALNKSWSKQDVIKELPSGWKRVEGATTAPNGYVVVSNNKSRLGGERETKLIKQEDFEKSTASSEPQNEEGNPALEASSKELDSLYKKSGVDEFVKTSMSEVRSGKKSLDQHWIDLEKFKKSSPFYEQIKSEEKKNHKLRGWKTESTDSAPRALTGDCKVRVKK